MKLFSKIIVTLLILSLIWVYFLLNLIWLTYFQETAFFNLKIGISVQFILVYILGIVICISYLGLILFKKKNF